MSWKVQVLNEREEKWEDVDREDYNGLEEEEAKAKREHLNEITPHSYRAVEA